MSSTKNRQDELYGRFQQHSGLPGDHLKLFRDVIISCEHENQDIDNDSCCSSDVSDVSDELDITVKRYKPDGSEFTLADVPLKSLVNTIEEHIQTYVPEHRRTEVYKKVVEGFHGIKQTPRWDRQLDNPRATPQTPFSESRARLESRITNEALFKNFASASKLSRETLARIRGQIVWCDSERSNGTWGAIAWRTFEVTGGRLGPTTQHTLADVPHCYVRDRLMLYTSISMDPERCELVRKAVFSDLTPLQTKQYAAAVEEMEVQAEKHRPAKAKRPRRSREVVDRARLVREIQYSRKINLKEAECIMEEEELLDTIDDTINLAPNPEFTALMKKNLEKNHDSIFTSIKRSALRPDAFVQKDDDVSVPIECNIDRDCDQIRAMIKILVRKGHWTMDKLIRALGGPRHRQMIQFLEKRGPRQGKESSVFQQSWDFFKRRELLGFELTAPPPKPPREARELAQLRVVEPNRGKKRRSQEGSDRWGKLQKTSRC
ncbi:hypothetical protein F5B21DRAFT_428231 [Xylaria acuta]|nr:hypothetical protein F5B21DRAFT_428231 [Xylaria acuta]